MANPFSKVGPSTPPLPSHRTRLSKLRGCVAQATSVASASGARLRTRSRGYIARWASAAGGREAALPSAAAIGVLRQLGAAWHCAAVPSDTEYEMMLERLWAATLGRQESAAPFERDGSRWLLLGFQRTNPDYDFRSGGLLSLECLLYLAERKFAFEPACSICDMLRERAAQRRPDGDETSGWAGSVVATGSATSWQSDEYPIAITGVNIVAWLCQLLEVGDDPAAVTPQTWWPLLEEPNAFCELFCAAFRIFDGIWHMQHLDCMQFGEALEAARVAIIEILGAAAAGGSGVLARVHSLVGSWLVQCCQGEDGSEGEDELSASVGGGRGNLARALAPWACDGEDSAPVQPLAIRAGRAETKTDGRSRTKSAAMSVLRIARKALRRDAEPAGVQATAEQLSEPPQDQIDGKALLAAARARAKSRSSAAEASAESTDEVSCLISGALETLSSGHIPDDAATTISKASESLDLATSRPDPGPSL